MTIYRQLNEKGKKDVRSKAKQKIERRKKIHFLLSSRVEHYINWKFFTCCEILYLHRGNVFFLSIFHGNFHITVFFDRFEDFLIVQRVSHYVDGRAFKYPLEYYVNCKFFSFSNYVRKFSSYKFYAALGKPYKLSQFRLKISRTSSWLMCLLRKYSPFYFMFTSNEL